MSWRKDTGVLSVISRTQFALCLFVFSIFCARDAVSVRLRWKQLRSIAVSHGNRHFKKEKKKKRKRFTHRLNFFYIVFRYTARDDTIGLLEFYFVCLFFCPSPSASFARFVSHNPRPLVSFSLGGVHKPSRWETINLEYPACSKRTEWKIFFLHGNIPLWVSFFFRGLAGTRMHLRVLKYPKGVSSCFPTFVQRKRRAFLFRNFIAGFIKI